MDFYIDFIILCLILALNGDFCRKFLKEIMNQGLLSQTGQYILTVFLIVYFLFGLIFQGKPLIVFFFYSLPAGIFLGFLFFRQKRKEKLFLENLYSLLSPLTAQMKLGLGFMDAWDKSLQTIKNPRERKPLLKISENLRFQKPCGHTHPEVRHFLCHLMSARKSEQALKQIRNLQQKVQVKLLFLRRSRQVLFQLRLQSTVMALLYGGLVLWNFFHYGLKYISLVFLSFTLFFTGIFWIFKTGKNLKWSL